MFEIRAARPEDLPSLLAIYNNVIATSTAVYSDTPATLEDREAWWRARVDQRYPVLVAVDDSDVLGFASFGDFRSWPGYRFTVEHSVHVRQDVRGTGVGTALMTRLIEEATALDKHVMIAGVDAQNAASVRFHERLGFVQVAHFREVGFKFGRWLDLVFLQRNLAQREVSPIAPSSADITIRRANSADSAALASLVTQLGYSTSPDQMIRRLDALAARDEWSIFVAEISGRVVGMAGVYRGYALEFDQPYARFTALAVDQAFRGRGIGKMLVSRVEAWAKSHNCTLVTLTSGNHRIEAHKFYAALGYDRTGVRFLKRL